MTASEALRELNKFFDDAGLQTSDIENGSEDAIPEDFDFDDTPEESSRESDKVSYEERLAECACEGPEFEEYVKIYNGDRTLAEYWFKKWKVGWEK